MSVDSKIYVDAGQPATLKLQLPHVTVKSCQRRHEDRINESGSLRDLYPRLGCGYRPVRLHTRRRAS